MSKICEHQGSLKCNYIYCFQDMRSINIPSILNEKRKETVASCKQNTLLLSPHHFCIHQELGYTNDAHETILMAHIMAHGVAIFDFLSHR